ncbi:MAG: hypothetical protein V3R86_05780 [Candidatus Hydrothermarchaeaceae archaeon]
MKKLLGLFIIIIALPFVFAWTDGTYIKNDLNKLYPLTSFPLYNQPVRVDANGDGDIDDEGDYVLYNEMYVLDGERKAELRLVYSIDPPSAITPDVQDFVGTVVEIGGKRYLITTANGWKITLGEPIEVKPNKQEKFDSSAGKPVVGDIKFQLVDTAADANKIGILYIMKGEDVLGTIDMDYEHSTGQFPNNTDMTSNIKDIAEDLKGYRIFLTDSKPRRTKFALIKSDELFDILSGRKDVLGYSEVKINDNEFGTGSNKGTGKIKFLSKLYTIEKDDEAKVEDSTPYRMQFNDKNKLRIIRYSFPITNETIKEQKANESAKISTAWRGKSIKSFSNKLLVLDDYGPKSVEVDANEDGDVRDEEDYTLYNELYILGGTPKAEVRLVYNLEPAKLSALLRGPFRNLLGNTLEIKGKKYLVTAAEGNKITLGEGPIEKTLKKQESQDSGTVVNFLGDVGMLRVGNPNRPSALGTLYIYKGDGALGSIELSIDKRDITHDVSGVTDVLEGYTVILSNTSVKDTKIAIVKTGNLKTIMDESTNVFGYDRAYVNSGEFPGGKDRLKLLSKLYTIEKDGEAQLEDNPVYTLQYNLYGEFKVKRGIFPKKVNETVDTSQTNESLFLTPVVLGAEEIPEDLSKVAGELEPEQVEVLLLKLQENQDEINRYLDSSGIPGPLKGFTSGRYTIHVGNETIGIVMDGGRLEEVMEGGVENPTSELWADEELLEKIATSDDPLGTIIEAQQTGELKKEDYGFIPKIKGFLMSIALKILSYFK